MRSLHFTFGLLALAQLGLSSCGKSSKGEDSEGSSQLLVAFKPVQKPSSTALGLAASASDFKNTAIASGRPDALTLYIKKMSLEGDSGVKVIFSDATGKPIKVRDKTIDISELFTNYACVDNTGTPIEGVGECPCGLDDNKVPVALDAASNSCPDTGNGSVASVPLDSGVFSKLKVEFAVGATVKGCVTGNFSTVNSNGAATQGQRTYCTKADASTFQATPGVAAASSLESGTAEEMDYQINKTNQFASDKTQSFEMSFPIQGNLTLTPDGASPLMTMVIDTNRMLRFYNMNRTQAPNPGLSDNRAYFFNTVFEESAFVFVGASGSIRGFKWWTEACQGNTTGAACTGNKDIVAGWMTVIKDTDNKPLVVGLMPDDDNSLTIIKGSNKSSSGIDTTAFVANASNFDVVYKLGTEGGGTLKNVNLDADLSSIQTTSFTSQIQSNIYGGTVYVQRGL